MENYNNAFLAVMSNEGGYANDPSDRGGETYAGISRISNPTWSGWQSIDVVKNQLLNKVEKLNQTLKENKNLQDNIKKYYKQKYWDILQLDSLNNSVLSEKIFDISVNMGPRKAGLILQEALNLLNQNSRKYPDITLDGIVGPKTIELANNHLMPALLIKVVGYLKAEKYINILRSDGAQEKFAQSWFSRI